MNSISIVHIRAHLSESLNRVAYGGERVTLERHGKPVAVLVSMEDLRKLEALEDAADVRDAKVARKQKGGVTLQQIKTELGL